MYARAISRPIRRNARRPYNFIRYSPREKVRRMSSRIMLVLAAGLCVSTSAFAEDRTMDGSGNNVSHPAWGSTGSLLIRGPMPAYYADGLGAPMARPNPRAISNFVSDQSVGALGNARNLSSMAWQWGQFMDHDFSLVDESTTDSMPIAIPAGDPVFDPSNTGTATMPFMRSVCVDGITSPRQQPNAITHYLDGSGVYGSDTARDTALRTHSGGRLATSAGNMLPFNTAGLPNAGGTSASLYLAGDIRCNEQTGLTAMHTVFVREHNRLADQIAAANPGWSDDQVFEKARKLVGGEIQAITYNEWLPAMMGSTAPGAYAGYNPAVDSSMNTAFTTAAFRVGHTMLNDQLLRLNADGSTFAGGHLNLFQSFFNPASISAPGSLDAVLRGLVAQQSNEVDTQAIDGVRNLLFGGTDGRDLIALNIQRGRDHGLPDYNSLRVGYGLPALTSFSQITSDPALAAALAAAYGGDINNVDPWIGLFAEDHLSGSSLGVTSTAIFFDQFTRLRDGDRFFYLNDDSLTPADLAFLGNITLADIISLNTGAELGGNIFFTQTIPAPGALALMGIAAVGIRRRRR